MELSVQQENDLIIQYESFLRKKVYHKLLECGWLSQDARKVLPNSTATKIVMKANLREWRHIFALRTSPAAYPEIRA